MEAELMPFGAYAAHIEDIDPYVCPRHELIQAMREAPSEVLLLSLYSIFNVRQTTAQIAGRSFS
jgi:hypothetical protein